MQLKRMHLREKLFLALVLGWAYCVPGCAHADLAPVASVAAHDAAGCVLACNGATAVELEPTQNLGDLCKCWAPNAFAYTFSYPDTTEKLVYSRERWDKGLRDVAACTTAGLPWAADATRDNIICVQPEIDPLKHTFLRLRGDGEMWPRFVVRPAWTQWITPEKRA